MFQKSKAFKRMPDISESSKDSGIMRTVNPTPEITFGVCAIPDQAENLQAAGYSFLEGSVAEILKPEISDAEYAPLLAKLKASPLPFRSCNGFFPERFRLTGPKPVHDAALKYALRACQRADDVGVLFIVLGSAGARNVPEGFDMAEGKAQFITFCRELGEMIKDCNVTVLLEPLNRDESNILNSVADGIEYVDAVNRPRIKLLADFYHMLKEKESPDSIRKAGARLRHCHIAELEGRMAPGTNSEDFGEYFAALKEIGYVGGVSCECHWPDEKIEEAWRKAVDTMRHQSACR